MEGETNRDGRKRERERERESEREKRERERDGESERKRLQNETKNWLFFAFCFIVFGILSVSGQPEEIMERIFSRLLGCQDTISSSSCPTFFAFLLF